MISRSCAVKDWRVNLYYHRGILGVHVAQGVLVYAAPVGH